MIKKNMLIVAIIIALATLFISCSFFTKKKELTLEKQGVNMEHFFEFDECYAKYNGKTFTIGDSIHQMVEVFGPYDRKVKSVNYVYIWDSLGLVMTTYWREDPEGTKVNNIYLYWNAEIYEKDYNDRVSQRMKLYEKAIELLPKKFFQGKILIAGIPLGRGMHIDEYRDKSTEMYFNTRQFNQLYEHTMRYCADHILTDKVDAIYALRYLIRVSEDKQDIEGLIFSAVFRGF